ncbi:helix-turn-helix domain-containing protein [Granulicoccus phenolivorans]|uniref:helix-turn-helix domain-containing protein n=1 Tax=Granulicoccus phenolivorans TaxID=266854 RepID=UPI00054D2868|nr:AraC family transcriptional regulator [Granulicoccus phenolivorans]
MQIPHRVHPALRGLVARMEGYAYCPPPGSVHHGVPGPTATVIIAFDDPLDVGWPDGSRPRDRHWLSAAGLHLAPALIFTHGLQVGIEIDLTPAGCRALLGLPIGALAHEVVDQADVPFGIPAPLHARMAAAGWSTRLRLLEQHLLARSADPAEPGRDLPADLAHAWQVLGRYAGRVRVADLAAEVGWSRRHLVTRFRAEFGLAPSELARLHRFGAAQAYARAGTGWSEVAARAGYADQAHLAREFRTLSGQTPQRWLTQMFPSVQDPAFSRRAG